MSIRLRCLDSFYPFCFSHWSFHNSLFFLYFHYFFNFAINVRASRWGLLAFDFPPDCSLEAACCLRFGYCLHLRLDEDSVRTCVCFFACSVLLFLHCFVLITHPSHLNLPQLLDEVGEASLTLRSSSLFAFGQWATDSLPQLFHAVDETNWLIAVAFFTKSVVVSAFLSFLDFYSYIKKTSISFLIFFHIFDKFHLSPEHPDWHNDIILSFIPHHLSFWSISLLSFLFLGNFMLVQESFDLRTISWIFLL